MIKWKNLFKIWVTNFSLFAPLSFLGVPLDYQPPYFEYVGTNPTLEDMRNIAVHKQIKPTLPPRFGDDFVSTSLSNKNGNKLFISDVVVFLIAFINSAMTVIRIIS